VCAEKLAAAGIGHKLDQLFTVMVWMASASGTGYAKVNNHLIH